jgi:hypothetical protein
MPILDVGLVTRVVKRVIELSVTNSTAWSPRPDPTISVLPPDKLEDGSLGIYLYHLSEDPSFKNQPPAGTSADPVPVRYTPMCLNLFYLITTDAKADTDNKMLDAQLLLGLAIKSLHDHPSLTDASVVENIKVFEDVGLDKTDTRLRITMQPTAHNEAVSYWTAGQSPLRLSAYYNISVVLLEPEEPPTRASRVLDYGVHAFVTGSPRLATSKSTLSVTIPDTGETQEIELRPAQVPIGSRIELLGVNLSGDDTELILNNSRWSEPVKADFSWGVTATDDRVIATVQDQIDGINLLPDTYTAKALVSQYRTKPDGSTHTFTKTSNETPFSITPRIDSISIPDASGNVTVTITPRIDTISASDASGNVRVIGYGFQDADIAAEDLQVFLGIDLLARGMEDTLDRGEFAITDPGILTLRLPNGTSPGHAPFRLLINGAESPPAWIEVP